MPPVAFRASDGSEVEAFAIEADRWDAMRKSRKALILWPERNGQPY